MNQNTTQTQARPATSVDVLAETLLEVLEGASDRDLAKLKDAVARCKAATRNSTVWHVPGFAKLVGAMEEAASRNEEEAQ